MPELAFGAAGQDHHRRRGCVLDLPHDFFT
jgi:hypothetical protein